MKRREKTPAAGDFVSAAGVFWGRSAFIRDSLAFQRNDGKLLAQGSEELHDGRDVRTRRAALQACDDGLADAAHFFELLLRDAPLGARLDEFADQGDAQIALGDFFGVRKESI